MEQLLEWEQSNFIPNCPLYIVPVTKDFSAGFLIRIEHLVENDAWEVQLLNGMVYKLVNGSILEVDRIKMVAEELLANYAARISGMMQPRQMDPKISGERMKVIGDTVKSILPKDFGFCIITLSTETPEGQIWQYVSNCERKDMIGGLAQLLQKWVETDPTISN